MQHQIPGPNHTAEYQVSGLPYAFATGSSFSGSIGFPYVTQWFMLRSTGVTTTFGFTEGGLNGSNHFAITGSSGFSYPIHVKVKKLWVSSSGGGFEIIAGLTAVPPEKLWDYVHPPAAGTVGGVNSTGSYTGFGYDGI